ncbi:MAG: hypothetical protein IIC80_03775 [Chloroflexi bacterium]|nr:hypothetical protein [Chloroflexota bacterium]MCH8284569.1 hypothetical protein [Chloroflexota bacterium]
MATLRIYTGDDGRTHFEEIEGLFTASGARDAAAYQPTTGIMFRHTKGETFMDWHGAPQRQYVIILSGEMEVEIGDGSKRRLVAGDVLLAEDTTGQGHITRGWGDRRIAIIPLA